MNQLFCIFLIIFGLLIFYITYKDGRNKKSSLTTDYIMHLKGYIGGAGLILMGLIMLLK